MYLLKKPNQPTSQELHKNGKSFPTNYLHKSWRDYLYWDTELENQIFFEIAIAVLQPVLIIFDNKL